ncbi:MAG: phosphoribosylanthranilate isomerase [Firmicutes bacterium]|nr:phosphoribosylanthranilate isomerase [Bacillota bacterium]
MTRVKVCGITRPEDAEAADRAGADAVGLIFAPSPRRIDLRQATAIERVLSPWIVRVGVFVDAGLAAMDRAIAAARLDVLQLHGRETPEFVRKVREEFGLRIVKSVRVGDGLDLVRLDEYEVDAFLFDTYVPGRAGGTGKTFDWDLAVPWARRVRLILAGGLTPENVGEAVRRVRPYGVDVASGVEREPGVKDHTKMQRFIANVRQMEAT